MLRAETRAETTPHRVQSWLRILLGIALSRQIRVIVNSDCGDLDVRQQRGVLAVHNFN